MNVVFTLSKACDSIDTHTKCEDCPFSVKRYACSLTKMVLILDIHRTFKHRYPEAECIEWLIGFGGIRWTSIV